MEKERKIIEFKDFINSGVSFSSLGNTGVRCYYRNVETDKVAELVVYPDEIDQIINRSKNLICDVVDDYFERFFEEHNIVLTFGRVDTASTDGRVIYANPAYLYRIFLEANTSPKLVAFTLLHEAFHISLGHNEQLYDPKIVAKYPNHKRVNIAMDLEVNFTLENGLYLKDKGTNKIMNLFAGASKELGIYYNENYCGMTWEEIYEYVDETVLKMKPDNLVLWSPGETEITREELEEFLKREREREHFIKNDKFSDDAVKGYNTIVDEFEQMYKKGMSAEDAVSFLKAKYNIKGDIIKM